MTKSFMQVFFEKMDAVVVHRYVGRPGIAVENCLGIEVERSQFPGIFFSKCIFNANPSENEPWALDIEDVAYKFREMKMDCVGINPIVYFPSIKFVEG